MFLEHDVDNPQGNRYDRWWRANGTGTVYLPLVMVDSGNQISSGSESFAHRYRSMVNAAMERPPRVRLEVSRERVDNSFHFEILVTNLSEATLGVENAAMVHALVYVELNIADTGRFVRAAKGQPIAALVPGDSQVFTIDVPVHSADWSKLHSVVLVDYEPDGSTGPYDMLQAAHQD